MSHQKTIIVNAAALRSGGALSIYRQFIAHLHNHLSGHKWIIFVDPTVEQPSMEGVTFVSDLNHSWKHRIFWDFGGLKRWLKVHSISPDVIVSLQNTGCICGCRQVVYYHQPLPFYSRKWSFWKPTERIMWLYKNIYPWIVKSSLDVANTDVIVQIPFIKRAFVKRYNFNEDRVHVMFPDIERINVASIVPLKLDESYVHILYPATPLPYKEHYTLVEALRLLKQQNAEFVKNVRIHLTFSEGDFPELDRLLLLYELQDHFIMDGKMPHDKLLQLYKACQALLFPSSIETLGLPLLEAAAFGLPIIASDLDYAHEVLEEYDGVVFVHPLDFQQWADEIIHICLKQELYSPLIEKKSSWNDFFELILKEK